MCAWHQQKSCARQQTNSSNQKSVRVMLVFCTSNTVCTSNAVCTSNTVCNSTYVVVAKGHIRDASVVKDLRDVGDILVAACRRLAGRDRVLRPRRLRVPANTMSHRNVRPSAQSGLLPNRNRRGVGAPHQCPRVNTNDVDESSILLDVPEKNSGRKKPPK